MFFVLSSIGVVLSQLQWFPFVRQTDRHHFLKQATSRLEEAAMQRTIEILVDFVESYFVSSAFVFLQLRSNFLACGVHRLDTFGKYPNNLNTCHNPNKIFGQLLTVVIVPEFTFSKNFNAQENRVLGL